MKSFVALAVISAFNMTPVAGQAAPMVMAAPTTQTIPVTQFKAAVMVPTIKVTVNYGPVKCTPRGCYEEIRPW